MNRHFTPVGAPSGAITGVASHPVGAPSGAITGARGFTLMEVLVALILLTLFSLVTFRALDAVLTSQRRASAEMAHWHELASTFARMESDLANAVPRPDPLNPYAGSFRILMNEDGSTQFDLVRLLPEDADQALMRVGYLCAGKTLVRLVWPDAGEASAEPKKFTLLDDLGSCTFQYMNELGQWLPAWQSRAGASFPRAVALDITTAGGISLRRVVHVQ